MSEQTLPRTFLEKEITKEQDALGRVNWARQVSFVGGVFGMALTAVSLHPFLTLFQQSRGFIQVLVGFDVLVFVTLDVLLLIVVPVSLRPVVRDFNKRIAETKLAQRAEQEVRSVLTNLDERQYAVFHGLYRGYGDIDHVVIGPTGAFVIETKSNRGDVSIDDIGRLAIDHGNRPHKNYRQQAIQEAYQLKYYLAEHGIQERLFVQSILAFPFANVPDGAHLGSINTGSYIPILGTKATLQYIYQHKASVSFTPGLVERCRAVLQRWADGTDQDTEEGTEDG